MENINNSPAISQNDAKPKSKLIIIIALAVLIIAGATVAFFAYLNRGNSTIKTDLENKSKVFVETYGNYSYLNPDRNLDAIQNLMTTSLYSSIKGDNQDYIYISNLRKTQFSIETKITGPSDTTKSGANYIVTIPVNEKSTLNTITQNENKTYTITWAQDKSDWRISDFTTNN